MILFGKIKVHFVLGRPPARDNAEIDFCPERLKIAYPRATPLQPNLQRILEGNRQGSEGNGQSLEGRNRRNRRNRRNQNLPAITLETTFLDQFLTLILMVTSDFADSVGVMPYFTMAAIGSATPGACQEVAYGRYIRYMTWNPGLNRCCTRCARCLRITPRASSHVAWSVAHSKGLNLHIGRCA